MVAGTAYGQANTQVIDTPYGQYQIQFGSVSYGNYWTDTSNYMIGGLDWSISLSDHKDSATQRQNLENAMTGVLNMHTPTIRITEWPIGYSAIGYVYVQMLQVNGRYASEEKEQCMAVFTIDNQVDVWLQTYNNPARWGDLIGTIKVTKL